MTNPNSDNQKNLTGLTHVTPEGPAAAKDRAQRPSEPQVATQPLHPCLPAIAGGAEADPVDPTSVRGKRTLDERAAEIGATFLGALVQARRMSDWSDAQLAKLAGVDRKTIQRVAAGSGSVETLVAVMNAIDFQLAGIGPGNTLEDQLAKRREKLNLTVEQVAAKTQMPEASVTDLEQGRGSIGDLFRLFALVAPGVRRRAPERVFWGKGDKADRDSRFTPAEFMASIYDAFGPVDLDPCAHPSSPVVASRRIIPAEGGDGLSDQWSGRLAFVNPPYSAQLDWLKRAHQQWSTGNVQTVVCLLPVRTDNRFFHEMLHRHADLFLLKGRLRFASVRGDVQPTPFSLWLVALGASPEQKARFAELVGGCWFRAVTSPGFHDEPVVRRPVRQPTPRFRLLKRKVGNGIGRRSSKLGTRARSR